MAFQDKLHQYATLVNEALNQHLMPGKHFGPPESLADAMRYAVIGKGKRLRPFIVMETARIFSVSPQRSTNVACAVECMHCYSLVHDDLPAMDDDDLRRGQPAVHKKFDEATAILAGDALQTLAFEILSRPEADPSAEIRARLVLELSTAAGWAGMAGGQMMDMDEEKQTKRKTRLAIIQRIHSMKTGALFEFCAVAGPTIAEASEEEIELFREYGKIIGLAFQASDDLLDVTSTQETAGKKTGKDAATGKPSIVARMGAEKTRNYLEKLETAAISYLKPFGPAAQDLAEATRFICRRDQ